jgi:hypothetical protein
MPTLSHKIQQGLEEEQGLVTNFMECPICFALCMLLSFRSFVSYALC